ncbi:PEP-CTERM sorting domain-containing protein [Cognaticolwellia aestuarii]|uniref:PEP-CTERM sorting domain-containing protein n=1 Tax=Cognaticolwellia aestuarii TaxID=329993 RepID=UPI0009864648|nr:PEP-CTERM sorting domain-containing protein [Cognaticolwellia aestuarii]
MLYSKKIIAALKASLLVLSISIVPNTYAGLINISSDYIVNVSLDGDQNSVGTVNGLANNEVIARERRDKSQKDKRIASFIQFDVSLLTLDLVNASDFSALFSADFSERLNIINDMSVMLGQVSSTWDNVAGTLPVFEMAGLSTNSAVLVNNIKTDTFDTYSLDVTDIVRSWVSGTSVNNGFVVYGAESVYQGAGFNNIALKVTAPVSSAVTVSEPTTLVIFGLAMIALASRRFKKQF